MKTLRALAACAIVLTCSQTFGGTEQPRAEGTTEELNPQRFELAVESGYLFGAFNPPQDYQIGTEFLTARVRWGVVQRDIWLRGYNQFYISAIAEPIFRNREPLLWAQSGNALQLCSTGEPVRSLLFGRTRFGMDRQSSRSSRWSGSEFYVQYFIGSRGFLPRGRSLEDKRRGALSASLEWRANRSQSQP